VSKWTDVELVLAGSSASHVDAPLGTCFAFRTDAWRDTAKQEITTHAGDGYAFRYAFGGANWEENRGTEEFVKAIVYIGGPDAPQYPAVAASYRLAGGRIAWKVFDTEKFAPVKKELRAAGAMTVTIRQVTIRQVPGWW
jgi:hypothetical protein